MEYQAVENVWCCSQKKLETTYTINIWFRYEESSLALMGLLNEKLFYFVFEFLLPLSDFHRCDGTHIALEDAEFHALYVNVSKDDFMRLYIKKIMTGHLAMLYQIKFYPG